MATCSELSLSQSPILHFALYIVVPFGVTTIELPVLPFDHMIVPSQPEPLRVPVSPKHTKVALQEMVGGAMLPTFICNVFDNELIQSVDTLQTAV